MVIGKTRTNQPVEGELEDKDLKVKTIEQSEPNYELDLEECLSDEDYATYFKSDTAYKAFKVINGVLWFVISGKFVAKAQNNNELIMGISIPNDFKTKCYSKLYRADGTTLNQDGTADILAMEAMCIQMEGAIYTRNFKIQCSLTANENLNLIVYGYGSTSDNGSIFMDIRIPLLII